jgi:hypothetical protein
MLSPPVTDDSALNSWLYSLSLEIAGFSEVEPGSISAATLADGSVTADKLATGAVINEKIAGLAVTTNKLADFSVTTGKLADLSVTTGKLVDLSVTTGKLANLAVTTSKIAPLSSVDFTPVTPQPYAEGRVFYDQDSKSLAYYNDASSVTVNLGREMLVRVYNDTGAAIFNGAAVYTSGSFGGVPTVALAIASSEEQTNSALGLATNSILNNAYGYITMLGAVNGLNTLEDSEGNIPGSPGLPVYLSATVAGGFTFIPPLQPNFQVRLGQLTNSSAIIGSIYARLSRSPWYPSLEVVETGSAIVLPTVPTVFAMNTTVYNDGFVYNSTTGEFTFLVSGTYSFTLILNATANAANKNVYFYGEVDTGSGYVISPYSGRQQGILNTTQIQLVISVNKYFPIGAKARFYLWADATVTLDTTNLPGTTAGTVKLPAARMTWS